MKDNRNYGQIGSTTTAHQEMQKAKQMAERMAVMPEPVSLIQDAFEGAQEALDGLGVNVDWLLQKIAPICQDTNYVDGAAEKCASPQAIEASPSALRGDLLRLTSIANSINSRIAAVKFSIEI